MKQANQKQANELPFVRQFQQEHLMDSLMKAVKDGGQDIGKILTRASWQSTLNHESRFHA